MNKRLILTVLLFLLSVTKTYACDVNLFSIIAGDTKEKSFIEATTNLAKASKDLNENLRSDNVSNKLENLMNLWLTFSNNYIVFPPEWGKTDDNWKEKFIDLGNILGEIRRYLGKDYPKTHSEIMKFSRRLSRLYEKMPKNHDSSILLDFTYSVDDLWINYDKQNFEEIRKIALNLNSKFIELNKIYKEKTKSKQLKNIEGRLENLKIYTEPEKKNNSFAIKILITSLEDDLSKLNEDISSATKLLPNIDSEK